ELEAVVSVAGDETLEAWSERTFAGLRDQHRTWLAEVVAGRDQPRPVGRATGAVTALGPMAFADKLPIAVTQAQPAQAETPVPSSIVPPPTGETLNSQLDIPPRRSLVPLIVLALLVVLGVGAAIFFLGRPSRSIPDAQIAMIDAARAVDAAVQVDA